MNEYIPPRISSSQSIIAFKDFAALAHRHNWNAQDLAQQFRGRIENATEFFGRVLSGKFPDSIVPYRSVIELYNTTRSTEPTEGRKLCACGCGEVVFDRKKWATSYCRQRAFNKKVRDYELSGV
jgi:hypothetical protein